MASHNTYHQDKLGILGSGNRGFSFFELIVVLAIAGILLSFSLSIDINYYRQTLFRSDRTVLVSVLERARSRAMNNYFGTTHGVCYVEPNYVLFQGDNCDETLPTSELYEVGANVDLDPIDFKVVFERLSGRVTSEVDVEISEGGKVSIININEEGRINW